MKKMINSEHIEGKLYEHNLSIKKVQNQNSDNFGKEFIAGTIDIAVDEKGMNVVQVHFTYVTETTKSGGKNSTYTALKKIIDEGKTWIVDGPELATKVKVDTALALNDFYVQDDQLVSLKTNEGGFVTIIGDLCPEGERNTFSEDMVITNIMKITPENEEDEEYVSVRGYTFNFRNNILPVEFIVRNKAGMSYFLNLDVTPAEPIFTKVWGRIISMTSIVKKEEESAFGEAAVHTYERKTREWVITGASQVPYDFGDEKILTQDDLTKAMQDREIMLAEAKKRRDEWQNSRIASNTANLAGAMNPPAAEGGFQF